ncbi:uncharacterized protein [Typha angustifolia]|uniref:uncharacterized protein n=1 Tax=Typha angustifolia TaxID=59011 RepID=UPI003C2C44A0
MVDVARRISALPPAHSAGLRRLSTRAAAAAPSLSSSSSSSSARSGLHSYSALAESLLSHLRSCGIAILPGLSAAELARVEAELGFPLPPDLRALLSLGLPSGPGFHDWRSPFHLLRSSLALPSAAVSLQIARRRRRPGDPVADLSRARAALRRAPPLIPLFRRCYLPALPSLAGNPVFLVDDARVSCCGVDIADFFRREIAFRSDSPLLRRQLSAPAPPPRPPSSTASRRSLDSAAGKIPRWIEFWSDAALDRRNRTPQLSPHPEQFLEIRIGRMPDWVQSYLERVGSVLSDGGWGEPEVEEMVHVAATSGVLDDASIVDGQVIHDALVLMAAQCSDSLRRAGWSSDEVSEVLGLDSRPEWRQRRPKVTLPPEIAIRFSKLAKAVLVDH